MHIHEYQAKKLLEGYGVTLSAFRLVTKASEVPKALEELKSKEVVVKVQIHAGGRGKAGGVKFAKTPEETEQIVKKLLGMKIINNQTGPQGIMVEKVILTLPVSIKKEYYLALTIDRERAAPLLIASSEGGMEIEEIAIKHPQRILKMPLGMNGKFKNYQLLRAAKFLGWNGELRKQGFTLLKQLAKAFMESDCSLLEINPLVETEEGMLLALDAKITIDDNALFRQKAISEWYDPSQSTENERLAKEYDLAYVGLDGQIGCMVNGAGLAMATMDIIHYYGGEPSNFLDVGGGASMEKVAHGFKIILLDPQVKAIFVNIFGGIMDCGVLAAGIVEASKRDQLRVPLIVRMEGTNVEQGKEILRKSGLDILTVDTMAEGAQKAVAAAKEG